MGTHWQPPPPFFLLFVFLMLSPFILPIMLSAPFTHAIFFLPNGTCPQHTRKGQANFLTQKTKLRNTKDNNEHKGPIWMKAWKSTRLNDISRNEYDENNIPPPPTHTHFLAEILFLPDKQQKINWCSLTLQQNSTFMLGKASHVEFLPATYQLGTKAQPENALQVAICVNMD